MPSSSESKLNFFTVEGVKFSLRNKTKLRSYLKNLFRKEGRRLGELNYIFCSDKYLLKINKDFLGHDYYTDIVSFEYSSRKEPLEGEVYISIDRVKDNAGSLGQPFSKELHRVIFHGALHFCGYKDKTASQKKKMRQKEDEYLKSY